MGLADRSKQDLKGLESKSDTSIVNEFKFNVRALDPLLSESSFPPPTTFSHLDNSSRGENQELDKSNLDGLQNLSKRHLKTLRSIIESARNIKWEQVESLMKALGGVINNSRSGSRVAITLDGNTKVMHMPHGNNSMIIGAVRDLKNWLIAQEVVA